MGCSFTKDAESPCKGSKGTSWHKVMHRGVTIQVDPSLKTTDGGYIAAIFSANYGILRKPGPVKASEKNDSLQMTPEKGGYPQHKMSVAVHSPQETSTADTVLGVPVLQHTKNASESSAAHKSVEGTKEKLETINILELMADLAEDEVSTNLEQWHTNPEPLIQLIERHESATVLSAEPSDETLACRASSGMRAVKRPRPKSFSSIKSVEDVDVALSTTRSKTPPPVKSLGESWPVCEHGRRFSEGSFHAGNGDIDSSARQTSSNATNTTDSRFDNESFRDPENLQRALSFKYMFNDNDRERQHFYIPDSSPTASQINETNARGCSSDCLVFAAARLLGEGDSNSASSSPAFSVAASLKDWLPSSNHPSEPPDDLKGGFEVSLLGSLQSHVWEECQPDRSSDTRKMRPMYNEGVSNRFRSQCQEGADNLSTRVEECEAPVFDPEMLDSFENAMKHLSKEDWDAVRSMEESPRNFLRLVKALKKSSSNSVRSQKAFGISMNHDFATASAADTDSKVGFERGKPWDSKLKKLSIEKKLFFMRQNSLEVEKTLAQVRTEEDEERAGVVFYSTTTRTDAKIYEDCRQVRGILRSLVGVCYDERSISELPEYEQELKQALNISSAIVPTIYAKGKYLVGADSIVHLYKQGMLVSMLNETAPYGSKTSMPCVCRGGKLLVCPLCKGTCKLSRVGEGSLLCRHCSGKGLIKCLNCSSG